MSSRLAAILIFALVMAGCAARVPQYEGGPLEEFDKATKYSAVDHRDGYEIHMFYEKDSGADAADTAVGILSAIFGVPGGGDLSEFAEDCRERVYWVAQHYAEKLDQLQPYLQWERAKRLGDELSRSRGSGIRLERSGGPIFQCHAYAYFRWKAHASQ